MLSEGRDEASLVRFPNLPVPLPSVLASPETASVTADETRNLKVKVK